VEAQKDPKPRRMSDLSFEPGFIIEIQMDFIPALKLLDKEMVLALIAGIDKRNPWFSSVLGDGEPDPIEIIWVSDTAFGGGKLRCTHERSVIYEKHLDAYLRYIQNIGKLLFQYLESFGVTNVIVLLELTTLVKVFSVRDRELILGSSSGGKKMD
jgi:hypothetical protein